MAWKGREKQQVDYSQLISILNNSRVQVTNNALWQVIYQLIQNAQQNKDLNVTQINNLIASLSDLSTTVINNASSLKDVKNASFITENDETRLLQNSRALVAGTGITLDTTTPGQLVVNSSGGGSLPVIYGIVSLRI